MSEEQGKELSMAKMQKKHHKIPGKNKKKISMLNDDCLVEIFLYLPLEERMKIENVCKQWRKISHWAWNDVKSLNDYSFIRPFESYVKENAFLMKKFITRCGQYLQFLHISYYCDSNILLAVRDNCTNLIELTLALEHWKTGHFTNFFKYMSKLKILKINWHHCHKMPVAFSKQIRKVGDTLVELNIDYFSQLENLYMEFPREWIKTFSVFKCLSILRIEHHIVDRRIMSAICEIKTLIKLLLFSVVIENLYLPDGSYLRTINELSNLKNLEELSMVDVCGINDDFLKKLSTGCEKLKALTIEFAPDVTDAGLTSIASMKNLKILSMRLDYDGEFQGESNVTDESIKKFKNMEQIDLYAFENITDSSIIHVINNSPRLCELWLLGSSISAESVLHAACVTKERTNNISLNLITDIYDLPDNFIVEPKYISPFLAITNFA